MDFTFSIFNDRSVYFYWVLFVHSFTKNFYCLAGSFEECVLMLWSRSASFWLSPNRSSEENRGQNLKSIWIYIWNSFFILRKCRRFDLNVMLRTSNSQRIFFGKNGARCLSGRSMLFFCRSSLHHSNFDFFHFSLYVFLSHHFKRISILLSIELFESNFMTFNWFTCEMKCDFSKSRNDESKNMNQEQGDRKNNNKVGKLNIDWQWQRWTRHDTLTHTYTITCEQKSRRNKFNFKLFAWSLFNRVQLQKHWNT